MALCFWGLVEVWCWIFLFWVLWNLSCSFSDIGSNAIFFLLQLPLSLGVWLFHTDLLWNPLTVPGGPCAKFKWLQATFFQVAHLWNVSVYPLAWQTRGLEAKPGWPLLPFPSHRTNYSFLLIGFFKWESASISLCVPNYSGHILFSD